MPRVESGQPFELLLSPQKYEKWPKPAGPCGGAETEPAENPCTPARARDLVTGRIIVPLIFKGGDRRMAAKYPQGTFAPIIFGIRGVDVCTLADPLFKLSETDLVTQGRVPFASETPFAQYFNTVEGFAELKHIKVKVHWPDHAVAGQVSHGGCCEDDIKLRCKEGGKTVHLSMSSLLKQVGLTVEGAMNNAQGRYMSEPPRHRCWGVARYHTECGIMREEVHVKALHHVGGITFQPELQIELKGGRAPHLFLPAGLDKSGKPGW